MSNDAMATLAAQVPTSMEDLSCVAGLGENVVKEYGERLVKNIKAFVEQENLQKYIDRRPAKKPRTTESSSSASATSGKKQSSTNRTNVKSDSEPNAVIDIDDEFDVGIDFGAIEIPSSKASSSKKNQPKKSSYF